LFKYRFSERRFKLDQTLLSDLDELTERISLLKRKENCASASVLDKKTVLTKNSLTHPLFNKKSDIIL
jgi:hypothetical protein